MTHHDGGQPWQMNYSFIVTKIKYLSHAKNTWSRGWFWTRLRLSWIPGWCFAGKTSSALRLLLEALRYITWDNCSRGATRLVPCRSKMLYWARYLTSPFLRTANIQILSGPYPFESSEFAHRRIIDTQCTQFVSHCSFTLVIVIYFLNLKAIP